MIMYPARLAKVSSWLLEISNNLNWIYGVFEQNLISETDIGDEYHQQIISHLHDLNVIIDDTIFNLENNIRG